MIILRRQHYWLLANVLETLPNSKDKTELVLKLCEMLKIDNPKFKPDLFIDACGV